MIASNSVEDARWPPELLQLKERFTDKYEKEIDELKKRHADEIAELKEDNLKKLNTFEKARRRSSKDDEIDVINDNNAIVKERFASFFLPFRALI